MDRPMRARQGQPPAYAGLRPRLAAFALDYILIAGYLVLVVAAGALVRLVAPGITSTLFGNPFTAELTGFITVTLPVILYFAVSEASRSEATWGSAAGTCASRAPKAGGSVCRVRCCAPR